MPRAAPSPCRHRGCRALVRDGSGYCEAHRKVRQAEVDERRGSAASRGYGAKWRAYREKYLRAHPLCRVCQGKGFVVAATVVDHVEPHRGDHRLFWNPANHQPLCGPCHSAKTAAEDGGFGNPRRGGGVG